MSGLSSDFLEKKLQMQKKFISSQEALEDITPIDWSEDVLSGKKKVSIESSKYDMNEKLKIDIKYPFNVYIMQVDKHKFWVAESKYLKGCVAQGETVEEAILELESNESEWINLAKMLNISVPDIPVEFTLNEMQEMMGKINKM